VVDTASVGNFRALVITIDMFASGPISMVIPRPTNDETATPPRNGSSGGSPGGWWAGIRPLLAALGWTPTTDRDTSYRSTDHRDITAAQRDPDAR